MTRVLDSAFFMRLNQALWRRLPAGLRDSRPLRWYGGLLHESVCRTADRRQYFGTFFLRNRPVLEQIRRLIDGLEPGAPLKLAVLGCSTGAEVYSTAWIIRSARPDLQLAIHAVDISAEILARARAAVYTSESSELSGRSVFERMTGAEREQMFDWQGTTASVKPWLREGIEWHLADASDPTLPARLGACDVVLASNFLCHMAPGDAERCLRNIARLVKPGAYLFVMGVDLDVRQRVARDLGWRPLPDLIREIHDGDPSIRADWPWQWWGLEPLDARRNDWQLRYAVAYQLG